MVIAVITDPRGSLSVFRRANVRPFFIIRMYVDTRICLCDPYGIFFLSDFAYELECKLPKQYLTNTSSLV